MKGVSNAKLILLQPSFPKGTFGSHHRLWLITIISFFTFATLFALLTTTTTTTATSRRDATTQPVGVPPNTISSAGLGLPPYVSDALLYYASASGAGIMAEPDIRAIAGVLRRRGPCNLLVFGVGPETPLWRALNHGGRTVFLDESEYYIAHFEGKHPGLEAYDVAYTTRVSELPELLAAARAALAADCRPVQNLLFSDCRLGINDLPNQLYEVPWDVILVDGPRGYSAASPGRMSAIFTSAVMARTAAGRGGRTDVLVHDYDREVERACSHEFLCGENLVQVVGQLAHFVVRGGAAARRDDFCFNRTATSAAEALV